MEYLRADEEMKSVLAPPDVVEPNQHLKKGLVLARSNGDPHPTSIQAVLTTRGQVDRAYGDKTGDPSQPVYLVQLTGDYDTCLNRATPTLTDRRKSLWPARPEVLSELSPPTHLAVLSLDEPA